MGWGGGQGGDIVVVVSSMMRKVWECDCVYYRGGNLSIKYTLNRGHLSNEDTVCSPNLIELCINLPLN